MSERQIDKLYREAVTNEEQTRTRGPRTRDRIRDYKNWAQSQGVPLNEDTASQFHQDSGYSDLSGPNGLSRDQNHNFYEKLRSDPNFDTPYPTDGTDMINRGGW